MNIVGELDNHSIKFFEARKVHQTIPIDDSCQLPHRVCENGSVHASSQWKMQIARNDATGYNSETFAQEVKVSRDTYVHRLQNSHLASCHAAYSAGNSSRHMCKFDYVWMRLQREDISILPGNNSCTVILTIYNLSIHCMYLLIFILQSSRNICLKDSIFS